MRKYNKCSNSNNSKSYKLITTMVITTITPRSKRTKSEQRGSKLVIICNNNETSNIIMCCFIQTLHLIHLRFIVYLPIWSMNSLYPWSCNSCSLYIKCMSIDDLNIIPAPFTLLVGRAWRLRYWRGTAHCTRRWYLPTPLPSPPIPTPSRWSRCSPVDGCSFSYWGL